MKIKKLILLTALITLCFALFYGCNDDDDGNELNVTDSYGNIVSLDATPERVVALQASAGALWQLAGGTLTGISDDYANYGLTLGDAEIVGGNHTPNIETIMSLAPNLVLYSAKISSHIAAARQLEQAHVKTYAVSVENFDEYLYTLKNFCTLTGKPDNYATYGANIKSQIATVIEQVPERDSYPSAILLRATSSNLYTISSNNFVIDILDNLKIRNVAGTRTNLEVVNHEFIVEQDPEYIFVTVMGKDSANTISRLNENYFEQPAWKNLSAVKNNKIIILPSDLFHYKPNERWIDSYTELYEIVYGG